MSKVHEALDTLSHQLPASTDKASDQIIDVEARNVVELSPLLGLVVHLVGGAVILIPAYYILKFLVIIVVGLFTCTFLGC